MVAINSAQSEILRHNDNRFVLFPIKFHQVWEMYKQHMAVFWTSEEIDLVPDLNDWENKYKNILEDCMGNNLNSIYFENIFLLFSNHIESDSLLIPNLMPFGCTFCPIIYSLFLLVLRKYDSFSFQCDCHDLLL